ncbi:transcriptional regulator, AraC family [Rhodopseudomonas palustris HaA2]|uniref:Transcriptional regulator, AraC family n=2 Tax=Rhodopseudomonas palustris TaxID=1076 RepID=Q2IWL4_RHOP2|nr:transcriptional regulator, AraC family [Rhodopseudomonas palustris HaA2]
MLPERLSKVVCADDLERFAGASGSELRLVTPGVGGRDPILVGEFQRVQLRSGLALHTSNTREVHDLHTEAVQHPGLTIALFLRGHIDAWFGGRLIEMGPRTEDARDIEAIVVARSESDSFVRRSVKGARIRKLNVTITPEWLDQQALLSSPECAAILRFSRTHLATLRWTASPRLITLAEQILGPPLFAAPLQKLYYESRAIDVVSEALLAISDAPAQSGSATIHPTHHRSVRRACDFIDANLDHELMLPSIAAAAGLNSGSLQRAFRLLYGVTVFEYVRSRKLDRARAALERDGISVGEAAYLAGYKTPGNFSTAFRRRFGVTPRQIRATS